MSTLAAPARAVEAASRANGRGKVLGAAFEAAERQPVCPESRERTLELLARGATAEEIGLEVETDVGLTIAVLRAADEPQPNAGFRCAADAVHRLGRDGTEAAVREAAVYDPLAGDDQAAWDADRSRFHVLTVQRAADRIAEATGIGDRDELALASILHDIGKPVLARLYPGYGQRFGRASGTPEERVARERRELGIDHALVGGVLARRWGLHADLAGAIDKHHAQRAEGPAAAIRVADAIAALIEGQPVDPGALRKAARRCGLDESGVRRILWELPLGRGEKRRSHGPCPLSGREVDVLRHLAEGKVYKQIARELELSPSTVRSHLHNVYGKLGAVDRAQAVLTATKRGWI
jgi:putative nucleotidyltransferase with HDIG domain